MKERERDLLFMLGAKADFQNTHRLLQLQWMQSALLLQLLLHSLLIDPLILIDGNTVVFRP